MIWLSDVFNYPHSISIGGRMYDPDKYELVPKVEYLEQRIKDLRAQIDERESEIKELKKMLESRKAQSKK